MIVFHSPFAIFVLLKTLLVSNIFLYRVLSLIVLYINKVSRLFTILFFVMLMPYTCATAQVVFSSGAHVDTSSPIDFVMGEYIAEDAVLASFGFLHSMMYSSGSCSFLLQDDGSVKAVFDNELLRATIYTERDRVLQNTLYYIVGIDGCIYLHGNIYNHTQLVDYHSLPPGVYVLQVVSSGYAPYVTRWIIK